MKNTTYLLLAIIVFVTLFVSACGGVLPPLRRKPRRRPCARTGRADYRSC